MVDLVTFFTKIVGVSGGSFFGKFHVVSCVVRKEVPHFLCSRGKSLSIMLYEAGLMIFL